MPRYIPAYENSNRPLVPVVNEELSPSHIKLISVRGGENWSSVQQGCESAARVLTTACALGIGKVDFWSTGRGRSLSEGMADCGAPGGGRTDGRFEPSRATPDEMEIARVGDQKILSSRRCRHILGRNDSGCVGSLLVFDPFAARFMLDDAGMSLLCRARAGSTVIIDKGRHLSATSPVSSMNSFTIPAENRGRSLRLSFHFRHEHLTRKIPVGIEMVAKFEATTRPSTRCGT